MLKVLAIMPARQGSKRLVKKNLKNLNGKPLFQWTTEFMMNIKAELLKSGYDFQLLASTNIPEIHSYCQQLPFILNEMRPENLCTDHTSTFEVLKYELGRYVSNYNKPPDCILLFQPTSPFRSIKDIRRGLELFRANSFTTVGVKRHDINVEWLLSEDETNNATMRPLFGIEKFTQRSQDCKNCFSLTGSLYVISAKQILNGGSVFTDQLNYIEMENEYTIDIDDFADFEQAKLVFQ